MGDGCQVNPTGPGPATAHPSWSPTIYQAVHIPSSLCSLALMALGGFTAISIPHTTVWSPTLSEKMLSRLFVTLLVSSVGAVTSKTYLFLKSYDHLPVRTCAKQYPCLECKTALNFNSESSAFRFILISPPCPCLMGQDANFVSSGPTHALVIRSFIMTFRLNPGNSPTIEKDQMTTEGKSEWGRIISYLNLGKGTSHTGIYLLKENLAASNCFTVVRIQQPQ